MNQETIGLVQNTWSDVAEIAPQADKIFYNNLFDADPTLKPLFQSNMEDQGKKLMQMIGIAVSRLDQLDQLVPAIQQLAIRHVEYGVKDEHYQTVGAALLKTLEQGLGEKFTPQVKEAWTEVYTTMATVMIAATK